MDAIDALIQYGFKLVRVLDSTPLKGMCWKLSPPWLKPLMMKDRDSINALWGEINDNPELYEEILCKKGHELNV